MPRFLIRNDDVPCGTFLEEFKQFCELCDRYNFKIIQAITPLGDCYGIDSSWSNEQIKQFTGNRPLPQPFVDYLRGRNDIISVHGLWHTHQPSVNDIFEAVRILTELGLPPTYCTWPFNEPTEELDTYCSLKVSGKTERLEDFMPGMSLWEQIPTSPICYLHSWRFFRPNYYHLGQLEECLKTLDMHFKSLGE